MHDPLTVAVVVVTYNSADTISKCLESMSCIPFETHVTVVDNGSTDATLDIVSQFPCVQIITGHGNIGFGAAVNLGVEATHGTAVMVLNPDAYLEPGIDVVIEYATASSTISTGRMRGTDGAIRPNTYRFPNLRTVLQVSKASLAPQTKLGHVQGERHDVFSVDYAEGSLLIMNRLVWQRVGGFSSSYFMYGEDRDFCYRANRQGIDTVLVDSIAYSHHGGFGSSRQGWYVDGIMTYFTENDRRRLPIVRALLWGKFLVKTLIATARGNVTEARDYRSVLPKVRKWNTAK